MSSRLQHHYLRLLAHFGQQPTQTHLEALAELLCCTRRHVRGLLEQMAALGWLSWQGSAGRGRRSTLQLLASEAQLRLVRAGTLLEAGALDGAVAALGADGQQLVALLRSQLGQHQIQDRQLLRIPYYRRLGQLHPQRPCRRSEIHLLRQIFNGLTRINEENGELEPELAHHWHSEDGRHWTFHLRPAVRWHSGRLLEGADLLASLTALRQLPLFSHLQAVSWASPRRLTLELAEADYRLPWLLAHHSALILPREGVDPSPGRLPVGTGPYRVSRQDGRCLRLSAFDDYFGLRALLDDVEIWQLPELDSQQLAEALPTCSLTVELGRWSSREPTAAVQGSRELEQGGYFLLWDPDSPLAKVAAQRHEVLGCCRASQILARVPPETARYWSPSTSLLSHWYQVVEAPQREALPPGSRLTLCHHAEQPEYQLIAQAMQSLLAEQGITLDIRVVSHAEWYNGRVKADLWLGSVNLERPPEPSLMTWLLAVPLLRRVLETGAQGLPQWLYQWRRGESPVEACLAELIAGGWLQPLFHSWLRLNHPLGTHGLRLNSQGWFDFKSVWLS